MFQPQPLPLPGAFLLTLPAFSDERGEFVKTYHLPSMHRYGIEFSLRESYYSVSGVDVVRGMHFQTPPFQLSKFVFCPQGAILDVILDLRKESPTYGQHYSMTLSAENHHALFIPEGFAHGFKSLAADSITYYLVSSEYSREHDTGVHIASIGFDWGIACTTISPRDASFCTLTDFKSPF